MFIKFSVAILLCLLAKITYSEVIRINCSGYPLEISTFPSSLKTTVIVNNKNLNRVESGWTHKLEELEITNTRITFTETMNPPKKHRHEWINTRTYYEINRLSGSLFIQTKEYNFGGELLNQRTYPIDNCISAKTKF